MSREDIALLSIVGFLIAWVAVSSFLMKRDEKRRVKNSKVGSTLPILDLTDIIDDDDDHSQWLPKIIDDRSFKKIHHPKFINRC